MGWLFCGGDGWGGGVRWWLGVLIKKYFGRKWDKMLVVLMLDVGNVGVCWFCLYFFIFFSLF